MSAIEPFQFLSTKVALFKDFPEDKLDELIRGARTTTFEPNEALIEFGEEGRFLGVILDGSAEVSVTLNSGDRHRISMLKTGDVFGEMSLMTGDKTMADIIGVSRCKVLLIPQKLFSSALVYHPPAIKILSKMITEFLKKVAYGDAGNTLALSALQKSDDPYGFKLKSHDPMKLLVVNCGSSSLKYNLFSTGDETGDAGGVIERIGQEGTVHTFGAAGNKTTSKLPTGGHREAFAAMVGALTANNMGVLASLDEITAVGHRVVHGGDKFSSAIIITHDILDGIEGLSDLAPLHNPVNVVGIKEAIRLLPGVPQVAVFDTSFHHTLPPYAYLYGLPYEYYENDRIRRYGFHGMSHAYASLKAAEFLKRPYNELEVVTCHLGNGASVCAVDHGRSVDTSMGLTPAEGLLMGTRCGDIDPAILVHLMRKQGLGPDELDDLINKQSGLKGLSGISNDMREVEKAAEDGDHRALLAYKTFCYHVRKYIGAYLAAMGGLDALVFTGGIGQGSAGVRSLACQGLSCMDIHIDEKKNREASDAKETCQISTDDSPVCVLVVCADEERMIARQMLRAMDSQHVTSIIRTQTLAPVPIDVSAHHLHLSREHVEALFGQSYELTKESNLSQPGQYACKEKVDLVGPKGCVGHVRILGPTRRETQVEISMTEQFKLGIQPPIRASGDIEGTPGLTLKGPNGSVVIEKGVICALRHIHMTPEDALQFGIHDKDVVRVTVGGRRELIFGDVLIRVSPDFKLAMHIDTDEANAANITTGLIGHIDSIQSRG